jgi:hypothetical protein
MREITIDGVTYPSMRAAAIAIGIPYQTFYGVYAAGQPKTNYRAQVTIRGVTYETCKAAAVALGVSPNAIHVAMRANRLENVGLGLRRPKANAAK